MVYGGGEALDCHTEAVTGAQGKLAKFNAAWAASPGSGTEPLPLQGRSRIV